MRLRATRIILGGVLGATVMAACGANDAKDSKAGGLGPGQGGSSAGGSGFGGSSVGGSGFGGSGV